MARLIEERWHAVAFDVAFERLPAAGPDGMPIHDAHGLPKTVDAATLVFQHPPGPDGTVLIVRIPFVEEAKQELLRKLTGGVIVPAVNGGPPA